MNIKMRSILTVFITLAGLCFIACNHQKQVAKKEEVQVQTVSTTPDAAPDKGLVIYRVLVSFYSIGAGIDIETHDKFKEFLLNSHPKVMYEEVAWGREGEVDYCFRLFGMNKEDQQTFITDLKMIAEKSDRMRVEEDKSCSHKK